MRTKKITLLFTGDYRTFDKLLDSYKKIFDLLSEKYYTNLVFILKCEDIDKIKVLEINFPKSHILQAPEKEHKIKFPDSVLYGFYSFCSDIGYGLKYVSKKFKDSEIVIRLRYDLKINSNELLNCIKESINKKCNIFLRSKNFPEYKSYTDVFFIINNKLKLFDILIKQFNTHKFFIELYNTITKNNFHSFIPEVAFFYVVKSSGSNCDYFMNGAPYLLRSNGEKIPTSETRKSKKLKLKYFLFSHIYTTKKTIDKDFFSNQNSYVTKMIIHLNNSEVERKIIDRNTNYGRFNAIRILFRSNLSIKNKLTILHKLF